MELLTRRGFLWRVLSVVGLLTGGMLFNRCAFLSDDELTDRTFRTDEASGHTHSLTVKAADMKSPPSAGTTITTSEADSHTHDIDLTAEQLRKLGAYSTFQQETGEENGHTHNVNFR